ncbi:uncharacterized protein BO97DRAFT_407730 [Aspergillus homomorphus CBS 101889]|uniref:Uncharacterized protein n=1 Tax=Aspergillus homomorphus (strain CBS 101889) TaxID=1450537 RepID=A0A395HNN8_ASPHC|nr:hypothetical protein BO97DRAFT_407730 [Aspergillus homomorphus CBS 101889]RAL09370.1 hypothetical protein BO97DRAFT_407730 [Aspergillus homomorphus CBS 101889]
MRSSSAFILSYLLALLGSAITAAVPPNLSRQVIVFILLLSVPFLASYGLASFIGAALVRLD